jgi:hypothetical protein
MSLFDGVPHAVTLSISTCPACGKAHHLPLVFIEKEPGLWEGQCTWNLKPVYAALNDSGRLKVVTA